jgi:predicted GNAT superfamily acetyltransferase
MAGINAGVPSDRLLAEWRLDSPAVAARRAGREPPAPGTGGRVAIPQDFAALLRDHPEQALAERLRVRAALQAAFARGDQIAGFDRSAGAYLLAPAAAG